MNQPVQFSENEQKIIDDLFKKFPLLEIFRFLLAKISQKITTFEKPHVLDLELAFSLLEMQFYLKKFSVYFQRKLTPQDFENYQKIRNTFYHYASDSFELLIY